ncbi:DUF2474 domain-containing protein [Marinomonas spartinae]|nr:DUF2474 domain-containing protein [Marinomonas spartinae]MBJ7556787.1 DUF2474 domain-containing protein [Marinomonas spartinae]
MKKSLHRFKWLIIYWSLSVGALFLVSLVIHYAMDLAGMKSH